MTYTRPLTPLAALAALAALTGCTPTTPTTSPSSAQAPSPTTATLTAADGYAVDGDTLAVTIDGHDERVRLLGIDAPETGDCGANTAQARLQDLVDGQALTLTLDPIADDIDRFGRVLAYIATDTHDDLAHTLLTEGLVSAWWPAREPTPTRGDTYQATAARAQTDRAGSWGQCGTLGR